MPKLKKLKQKRGGVTRKPKKFMRQNQALPAAGLSDHEASYDLDALTKAEEIKKDGKRHSAAMVEGKRRHSVLSSVMSGPAPKDETEMRRYAAKRTKGKQVVM